VRDPWGEAVLPNSRHVRKGQKAQVSSRKVKAIEDSVLALLWLRDGHPVPRGFVRKLLSGVTG